MYLLVFLLFIRITSLYLFINSVLFVPLKKNHVRRQGASFKETKEAALRQREDKLREERARAAVVKASRREAEREAMMQVGGGTALYFT